MAEFGRKFLLEHGVPEDQIDAIMAARNQTMNDTLAGYTPKADVQKLIDDAVKKAVDSIEKPKPIDPTTTEEYMAVAAERDMLRALGGEGYAKVKPKFREQVYKMVDHGDKATKLEDQLAGIREKYEEYFVPDPQPAEPEPKKPTFGSPDEGVMPKGEEGAVRTFQKIWGFNPR